MKQINKKWHFSFIAIALLFALSISCKKEDSKNSANTNKNNPNVIVPPVYRIMTDQDGNTCKTVVIGTQTWMAEFQLSTDATLIRRVACL